MQERASPTGTQPESPPDGIAEGPQLNPGNPTFVAFAGRLGHDLNNLLSTVIGSLGLLREDSAGSSDPETRQLLDDALSAGRECADLVDRLMAAAGKQLLRPQRVAVNDIIEQLATLLEQTLPANIGLQVSMEPDLPDVDLDPDRFEAAIMDLVVNAREAMPTGGSLEIRTRLGEATGARPVLAPDRSYVQISVIDGGHGIPDDLRDRVLEPLYSTKSGGTGRGLGLSVANGFVQQSHGALSLDSEPGRGTRVTLHFPPAE
jgi:signal transduction histidine kinase